MFIKDITARKIIDSGAGWSLETKLILDDGSIGIASVPGGLSKGKSEVDAIDPNRAPELLEDLLPKLQNTDFSSQNDLDIRLIELDGTNNKSKLGGNLMLSISIAFCKACAKSKGLETYQYIHTLLEKDVPVDEVDFKIPKMYMLILEGGIHGSNDSTIQEFMAIVEDIQRGIDIYKDVKKALVSMGKSTNVGAEGAFSPEGFDNMSTLDLLSSHLKGEHIALDIAASSFEEGMEYPDYKKIVADYPIESIEDPYSEEQWAQWEYFASQFLNKVRIVTDDLTTTNPKFLREAINRKVGNSIIIKPNQIGTLYETLKVVKMAQENGWSTIVSHRGTDTNDDFIADLAVGIGSQYVKFGSPARGERTAKYNRLLQIQDSL